MRPLTRPCHVSIYEQATPGRLGSPHFPFSAELTDHTVRIVPDESPDLLFSSFVSLVSSISFLFNYTIIAAHALACSTVTYPNGPG